MWWWFVTWSTHDLIHIYKKAHQNTKHTRKHLTTLTCSQKIIISNMSRSRLCDLVPHVSLLYYIYYIGLKFSLHSSTHSPKFQVGDDYFPKTIQSILYVSVACSWNDDDAWSWFPRFVLLFISILSVEKVHTESQRHGYSRRRRYIRWSSNQEDNCRM